jgi:hypothetical protein
MVSASGRDWEVYNPALHQINQLVVQCRHAPRAFGHHESDQLHDGARGGRTQFYQKLYIFSCGLSGFHWRKRLTKKTPKRGIWRSMWRTAQSRP